MAFTQNDIDQLKRAIATGALRVQFKDRTVTYRSLKEMRETLSVMMADVAPQNRTKLGTVKVLSSHSKGLH